jgi:hypothetical protein
MPQIINPFRPQNTPLAQAITQVGKDIYGDQLTPALKREQLIAAQRGNVETDALAQSFADPAGGVDYQAMIASGYKPSDAADARLMQQAEAFGARAPQTQRAQIGAGQGYDNLADAFDTKIATTRRGQDIESSDRRFNYNLDDTRQRWEFSNTPEKAMVNGQPVFLQREKVYGEGVQPILSRGQTITTNPQTGEVTIESGGLYGEPTNSVKSGAQEALAGIDAFDFSIERAKDMAARSPDAFGVMGTVKGVAQDVNAIAQNIGLVAGGSDVNTELAKAQAFFANAGVSPEVFGGYNPDISNIDALSRLMVYQAAQALTQQTGRSVSDADVKNMTMIVGDPKAWTMNPDKFVNRMDMLQEFIDTLADQKRAQLGLPPIVGERAARRQKRNEARAVAPGATAPGGNKRIRFNPATGDFEE